MKLQLIRSATLRLTYAGQTILIDPSLAAKDAYGPLVGKARNPMVDLPVTVEQALAGIEMTIISHLHSDHFDAVAMEAIPKEMLIYCQPGNEEFISGKGFQNVHPIRDSVTWNGIEITRTTGRHGSGEWAEKMGAVSGFIFRAPGEPALYWMGDTIWYEPVEAIVAAQQPAVIVTHSCSAEFAPHDPIVMDAVQTAAVCKAAPWAVVVAVHMEAYDHSTVSRLDLRAFADEQGISPEQLRIPADGETLLFE